MGRDVGSDRHQKRFRDQLERLFHALDTDASGFVEIEEFVDGLQRITEQTQVNDRHVLARIDKLCPAHALTHKQTCFQSEIFRNWRRGPAAHVPEKPRER